MIFTYFIMLMAGPIYWNDFARSSQKSNFSISENTFFKGSCNQNLLNDEEKNNIVKIHKQIFTDLLNGANLGDLNKKKTNLLQNLNAKSGSNKEQLALDFLKTLDLIAIKKYMDDITFSLSFKKRNGEEITPKDLASLNYLEPYFSYKDYHTALISLSLGIKDMPQEYLDLLSNLDGTAVYKQKVLAKIEENQEHFKALESKSIVITSTGLDFSKFKSTNNEIIVSSDLFKNPKISEAIESLFSLDTKLKLLDPSEVDAVVVKNKVIIPKYPYAAGTHILTASNTVLTHNQKIIMDKIEYDKKVTKEVLQLNKWSQKYIETATNIDSYIAAGLALRNGLTDFIKAQNEAFFYINKARLNLIDLGYQSTQLRAIESSMDEIKNFNKMALENNQTKGQHIVIAAPIIALTTYVSWPVITASLGKFTLASGTKAAISSLSMSAAIEIGISTIDSYYNSTNGDLFCSIVEGLQKGSKKFINNLSLTDALIPLALGGVGKIGNYLLYQSVGTMTDRRAEIISPFLGITPEEYINNESKLGTLENYIAIGASITKTAIAFRLLGKNGYFNPRPVKEGVSGISKFLIQNSHYISPIAMGLSGSLGSVLQSMEKKEDFNWQKLLTDAHISISSSLVFMGAIQNNAASRVKSGLWSPDFAEQFSSKLDLFEAIPGLINGSVNVVDELAKLHLGQSGFNGFKLSGLFISLGTEIYDSMDGVLSGWINVKVGNTHEISKMNAGNDKLITFIKDLTGKTNITKSEAISILLKERLSFDINGTPLTASETIQMALAFQEELIKDNLHLENAEQKNKDEIRSINNELLSKLNTFLNSFNTINTTDSSVITKLVEDQLNAMIISPYTKSDITRITQAEKLIGKLSENQKNAILRAHLIGKGEIGKDGTIARIYNYTTLHINAKDRILEEAGIDRTNRRKLIEAGIVGDKFLVIERNLTDKEIRAIIDAKMLDSIGQDNKTSTFFGNFSSNQIWQIDRTLRDGGFSKDERESLIKYGSVALSSNNYSKILHNITDTEQALLTKSFIEHSIGVSIPVKDSAGNITNGKIRSWNDEKTIATIYIESLDKASVKIEKHINEILPFPVKEPTKTIIGLTIKNDTQRLEVAKKILHKSELTTNEQAAILEAHYVGLNELGKDGTAAGIGNYTTLQLSRKAHILASAEFSGVEIRTLMEAGIVGIRDTMELEILGALMEKHFDESLLDPFTLISQTRNFLAAFDLQNNFQMNDTEFSSMLKKFFKVTDQSLKIILNYDRKMFITNMQNLVLGYYRTIEHELGHELVAIAMDLASGTEIHDYYDLEVFPNYEYVDSFDLGTVVTYLFTNGPNFWGGKTNISHKDNNLSGSKYPYATALDNLSGFIANYQSQTDSSLLDSDIKGADIDFMIFANGYQKLHVDQTITDAHFKQDVINFSYIINDTITANKDIISKLLELVAQNGLITSDELKAFYKDHPIQIPASLIQLMQSPDDHFVITPQQRDPIFDERVIETIIKESRKTLADYILPEPLSYGQ